MASEASPITAAARAGRRKYSPMRARAPPARARGPLRGAATRSPPPRAAASFPPPRGRPSGGLAGRLSRLARAFLGFAVTPPSPLAPRPAPSYPFTPRAFPTPHYHVTPVTDAGPPSLRGRSGGRGVERGAVAGGTPVSRRSVVRRDPREGPDASSRPAPIATSDRPLRRAGPAFLRVRVSHSSGLTQRRTSERAPPPTATPGFSRIKPPPTPVLLRLLNPGAQTPPPLSFSGLGLVFFLIQLIKPRISTVRP